MTTGATTEADYEAALGALIALVGCHVQVLWHAGERLIGGSGGVLIDAVPMEAGTAEESIAFRIVGGSVFILDRATFRGWRLHLIDGGIAGIDLLVAGDGEVKLTTDEAR